MTDLLTTVPSVCREFSQAFLLSVRSLTLHFSPTHWSPSPGFSAHLSLVPFTPHTAWGDA